MASRYIRLPQAINDLTYASALALFMLMLFVPASYQTIKAALLALVMSGIVWGFFIGTVTIALHRLIMVWVAVIVLTGVFFITRGWLNDAPGAIRVGTVYVLWPLVFIVLIAAIPGRGGLQALLATLMIAAVAIGLYGASYIANAAGWWPDSLYWVLDQGQAIGFYDGFVEYNMYSVSVLIALVPILAGAIVDWDKHQSPLPRIWLWLGYTLCLALAILSGRRALWIVLLFSPFIYFLLSAFQPTGWQLMRTRLITAGKLMALSVLVFFVLSALFDLSVEKMLAQLASSMPRAPDSGGAVAGTADMEVSASLRYEQMVALWQGFLAEPWFGHGHGSVAAVIRSNEMPWAYELTYLALLFHTGAVGTFLYVACVGWIYWQGVQVIRHSAMYGPWMLAVLTGVSGLLIANATNPYLAKFDFMWVLFLPLAIINRHLLEKSIEKDGV